MPKRKIIKRNITKEQFLTILDRAIAKKPTDSTSVQTSKSRPADGYIGKRTRSNKIGGT